MAYSRSIFSRQRWVSGLLLAICLTGISVVGLLDFSTGQEIQVSVLYLLPIAVPAWYGDRGSTSAAALFAALVGYLAEYATGTRYSHQLIAVWNAAVQFMFFFTVGWVLNRLRWAYEVEKRAARTDSLTGAANGKGFYESAASCFKRARTARLPVTLLYLDVDDFKEVNDRFGHASGDKLLRHLAEEIRHGVRETDLTARLGGDEFALVLEGLPPERARDTVVDLHARLTEALRRKEPPVTVSMGAVTFRRAPESLDAGLHEADEVMYQVKREGKNRVGYKEID